MSACPGLSARLLPAPSPPSPVCLTPRGSRPTPGCDDAHGYASSLHPAQTPSRRSRGLRVAFAQTDVQEEASHPPHPRPLHRRTPPPRLRAPPAPRLPTCTSQRQPDAPLAERESTLLLCSAPSGPTSLRAGAEVRARRRPAWAARCPSPVPSLLTAQAQWPLSLGTPAPAPGPVPRGTFGIYEHIRRNTSAALGSNTFPAGAGGLRGAGRQSCRRGQSKARQSLQLPAGTCFRGS